MKAEGADTLIEIPPDKGQRVGAVPPGGGVVSRHPFPDLGTVEEVEAGGHGGGFLLPAAAAAAVAVAEP